MRTLILTTLLTATLSWSLHAQTKLSGIGVSLKVDQGKLKVASLFPGGPAEKSGELKENDVIEAVGQGESELVPTAGKSIDEVGKLIRGEASSEIRLKVVPADSASVVYKLLALKRAKIDVPKRVASAPLNAGKEAPDISFEYLKTGEKQKLSDFAGKVVVIDFWATWCGPCQGPMAKMQTYAEKHPEWGDNVKLIALSIDRRKESVLPHLEKRGWTKTHNCWDAKEAPKAYNVRGIPNVYIIDQSGRVAASGHPASMNIPGIISGLLEDAKDSGGEVAPKAEEKAPEPKREIL